MSTSSPASDPAITRPRGRPPLSASDIARRRERIIAAAARMFFAEGFTETTLEAVGREAGVTKRTIYELIGDKNALFSAACDTLRIQGPNFEFDIPIAGRPTRDILLHMGRRLIDHSLAKELIAMERTVIVESTRCPELISDILARGKAVMVDAIADIFAAIAAQDDLPPFDTRRAPDLFYDVVVGARGFRAALGHPPEETSDDDLAQRVDMFLYGYLRRPG